LEHLSHASFLGKLLALPANVRLEWKVIARYKWSSLFGLNISDEGKTFYNVDTRTPHGNFFSRMSQVIKVGDCFGVSFPDWKGQNW
jgi:hypothetical protein